MPRSRFTGPIERRPGLVRRWLIGGSVFLVLSLAIGSLWGLHRRVFRRYLYHEDQALLYAQPLSFQEQNAQQAIITEEYVQRRGRPPTPTELNAEWFRVTAGWTRRAAYHAAMSKKYEAMLGRPAHWLRLTRDPPLPPVKRPHPAQGSWPRE